LSLGWKTVFEGNELQFGQLHEYMERKCEQYTLLFSLNGMMVLPEVKYSGGKLVPHSDLRVIDDCFKKKRQQGNKSLAYAYFNLCSECTLPNNPDILGIAVRNKRNPGG
jgi:hypothetical protein